MSETRVKVISWTATVAYWIIGMAIIVFLLGTLHLSDPAGTIVGIVVGFALYWSGMFLQLFLEERLEAL